MNTIQNFEPFIKSNLKCMSSAIFFVFGHFEINQPVGVSPGFHQAGSSSQAVYMTTISHILE